MGVLTWLTIPVAAGILAALWGSWSARTRAKPGDSDTLAGYERFREAMERKPGQP
ncbi:hypothetical protein [Streptacidiphilus monticola]|uniref:SHOCT domain-containing protein n=1 Tax=Streptacidiphilus monticola TaxID=2161674 RepID=A0ABW1G3U4_9ACTN